MPWTWWYLSFAGEEGWRGAAVVQGVDVASAAAEAWRLGVNPGGSVLALALPPERVPPTEFCNVRLSKADVHALDRLAGGDGQVVHLDVDDESGDARVTTEGADETA